MSTPLAVRNQANAQHSTGPRTPRGKAVACRNALQHGLLSDLPIATAGERREDWDQHSTQVCAALAPLGHLETVLAERAALHLWRQVRIARYETAMIDQGLVALEASVHGHRFALADARPSTAADLRARRDDLAQLMNLVNAVSEADPAAGFDAAEAQQILAAFLSTPECSSLPPTVLPARGKRRDLAHYCAGRAWTVASLQAALAAIAQAVGMDPDSLQMQVEEDLRQQEQVLRDALSDQEIALRRQTRSLPDGKVLDRIARYEAHLSRELARTLHELDAFQARRVAANCETDPPPSVGPEHTPGMDTPDTGAAGMDTPEAMPALPAVENCETKPAPATGPGQTPETDTPDAALVLPAVENCETKPAPAAGLPSLPSARRAAPDDAP